MGTMIKIDVPLKFPRLLERFRTKFTMFSIIIALMSNFNVVGKVLVTQKTLTACVTLEIYQT